MFSCMPTEDQGCAGVSFGRSSLSEARNQVQIRAKVEFREFSNLHCLILVVLDSQLVWADLNIVDQNNLTE